jgi:hypothetical protein
MTILYYGNNKPKPIRQIIILIVNGPKEWLLFHSVWLGIWALGEKKKTWQEQIFMSEFFYI